MRIRAILSAALAAVALFGAGAVLGAAPAQGVRVVVIDPGHGGKFPGAHYAGVYEKDLTLKVALKLGRLIEEGMPGVKVVYTRKTDKTMGADLASELQARADVANKAGGDLFLSIHVNAAPTKAARGVETLIMGESPKEQRYNENALFENNRDDLIDMSDERTAAIVRAYIQNLQFTYGEYSMALARCIQKSYVKAGRHSRGIKPQLLRVLYATDMPSVLTEIGFLSNAEEAAYLKSEKGQNEIAASLYRAVKEYSAHVAGIRGAVAGEAAPEAAAPETSETSEASEAPEAAAGSSDDRPEAADGTKEQPLRYAVQVMASPEAVRIDARRFGKWADRVREYAAEGTYRYKYCVCECATRAAAQKHLQEVKKRFPDAFVVKCRGSRIVN